MKTCDSNQKLPKLLLIVVLTSIGITASGIMISSSIVTPAYSSSSSSGSPSRSLSGTNDVSIIGIKKDKSFDPNPIEIKAGDSVTWTNDDNEIHTVTSGSSEGPTMGQDFDSGILASGKSFTHKFEKTGTFEYFCSFHESMIGKVVVK
jgi:aldose sugar dehydrogenase